VRKPPPRDAKGRIAPHDHPEILNEHHVIRHTTPQDLAPEGDEKRLSSGAFSESEGGGMSVDIEEWMEADGLDPLHYLTDAAHGAVRLNVGELRKQNLQVGWDPDDAHPHHGGVWGIGNGSKRKRRVREIAITLKKAEGETLPIPKRDAAAQAQSEAARARDSTSPTFSRDGLTHELVPVLAAGGAISLYDIYVIEDGRRTWIGSRRTVPQCQDAFVAFCEVTARQK
jgi:hypothetical protein